MRGGAEKGEEKAKKIKIMEKKIENRIGKYQEYGRGVCCC